MNRPALIALGAVIILAAGGAYLLTAIDRRANEVVVVPKVQLPAETGEVAATELPGPGSHSIFPEPEQSPPPTLENPAPAVATMCETLLTTPPQQKCPK